MSNGSLNFAAFVPGPGGASVSTAAAQHHADTKQPLPGNQPAVADPNKQVVDPNKQVIDPNKQQVTDPNDPNARNPDGTPKTKADSSPLDAFNELFKIDPNKTPTPNPLAEKLMELDPTKFGAAVAKMDFTRTLAPDLVSKALQGDVASFTQALNQALQGTFASAVQMLVGINEAAFRKNNDRVEAVLGDRFRNFQIQSSKPENKALQHPAAQPVLAALRAHIASSSPELPAYEVGKRAEDYFVAMGKAMQSVEQQVKDQTLQQHGTQEVDWTKFLEEGGKSI